MAQIATITSKRQLTIPVSIFKKMNLKKGQKVLISEDNGSIKIEPALALIQSLAGSVKIPPRFKGMLLEKIIAKAKKEHFKPK